MLHVPAILMALCVSSALAWCEDEVAEPPPLSDSASADAILDEVAARLPREPIRIAGSLVADPRGGRPGRRCQVQVDLAYGAEPAQARLTVMDAFGEELEQMTLFRFPDGSNSWHYARGYPLTPAPLPPAAESLQGTEMTWSDLALSFLGWRGGRVIGRERALDRDCLVLLVPAPPGEPTPYEQVRLWIDRRYRMLLRAEGCAADGTPRTRLAVKSLKKIGGEWMVQDLDVTALDTGLRTALRIATVDRLHPEVAAP